MPIKIKKKILLIIMMGQKPQTLNFGGNDVIVASMLLFSEVITLIQPKNQFKITTFNRFVKTLGVHLIFFEQLFKIMSQQELVIIRIYFKIKMFFNKIKSIYFIVFKLL